MAQHPIQQKIIYKSRKLAVYALYTLSRASFLTNPEIDIFFLKNERIISFSKDENNLPSVKKLEKMLLRGGIISFVSSTDIKDMRRFTVILRPEEENALVANFIYGMGENEEKVLKILKGE